jgi:hypothetical protein
MSASQNGPSVTRNRTAAPVTLDELAAIGDKLAALGGDIEGDRPAIRELVNKSHEMLSLYSIQEIGDIILDMYFTLHIRDAEHAHHFVSLIIGVHPVAEDLES